VAKLAARRHQWPWRATVDLVVAVTTAAITLAMLSHLGPGLSGARAQVPSVPEVLAAVLTAMPILLWRRQPLFMFITVYGCAAVFAGLGEIAWLPVGPAVALYLLTLRRDENMPWPPVSLVTVLSLAFTYVVVAGSAKGFDASGLFHAAIALAVAWFAGERTRLHHAHVAELASRAERAERDAARERDLAVAEERNRIARDLHDSAAHALNVIAVRAGAARLRHDPERDLAALTAIEELARETMNDIDQFVGTLRNPGGVVELPPGLAALDSLIGQHAASGHKVELARTGQPRLPAVATDHGVYRIVQEALTNAARYGDGTTRVRLAYNLDGLDLTVTNRLQPQAIAKASGGHGLIGMRERATSLDGELTAGPVDGDFVVHAFLPYQGRRP
jgi:signal transduction histidine kinase